MRPPGLAEWVGEFARIAPDEYATDENGVFVVDDAGNRILVDSWLSGEVFGRSIFFYRSSRFGGGVIFSNNKIGLLSPTLAPVSTT